MVDAFTLAGVLSTVALTAQVASIGVTIASSVVTADRLKTAARRTARQGKQNALDLLASAREDAAIRRRQGLLLRSAAKGRIAASGVRVGKGSALDLLAESENNTEFAVTRGLKLAGIQAFSQYKQGQLSASLLKAQAGGTLLGGAASAIGGLGNLASAGAGFYGGPSAPLKVGTATHFGGTPQLTGVQGLA